MSLSAVPIPGFPNTAQTVTGASHAEPEQVIRGQHIDLAAVLADRSPRRIVLDGWFQRSEYYHPYRMRIRDWLAFDSSIGVPGVRPGVVIHVRRRDYVSLGWALPFSYYAEALERIRPRRGDLWIATDDKHDPFLARFRAWRPKLLSGPAVAQMAWMSRASCLVLSQSSFSWWPTFLGNPELVVCPDPAFGIWSRVGAADETNLVEPDRFLCLPCPEPYAPTMVERLYQKHRALLSRAATAVYRQFKQ
jgi:hypothetical protein